jgi:hypothetical protein
MPLYFFRCATSDGYHSDIWGTSLPDLNAALAMAIAEAHSVSLHLSAAEVAEEAYRFEIEDEDGRPIMHVPLSLTRN